MRISSKLSMLALAMACALALSSTGVTRAADEAKATGTISGKVVDKDGKAVAGARVMALRPPEPREGDGPRGPRADGEGGKPRPQAEQGGAGDGERKPPREGGPGAEGGRRPMPKPLSEATTGADGTFVLKDVPVGKVGVVAHLRGVGVARSKAPVDVVEGKDTKVEDLVLQPPPRRGEGGAAGGGEGPRRGGPGAEGGKDNPK